MQVGLEDPTAQPVQVVSTTDDGMYRYSLHALDAIEVAKRTPEGGWETAYSVRSGACNCPGYQHRADCKHADVARGLAQWWRERRP